MSQIQSFAPVILKAGKILVTRASEVCDILVFEVVDSDSYVVFICFDTALLQLWLLIDQILKFVHLRFVCIHFSFYT